jgi:hypothetical protein
MKVPTKYLAMCLAMLCTQVGFANTSSWTATDATRNVSATFVTGTGTLMITLNNLFANPTDVTSNLSDLNFTLSGTSFSNTSMLSSSSGTEITVNSNAVGGYTVGSAVPAGWVLSQSGSSFLLNDLAGTGHAGPAHTIIGPSNNGTYSGGAYSNANGGIAGNPTHNPFLESGVTFTIADADITATTNITSVIFSFGTTAGNNLIGIKQIPEPTTVLSSFLAAGAVLFWLTQRRKMRTAKSY